MKTKIISLFSAVGILLIAAVPGPGFLTDIDSKNVRGSFNSSPSMPNKGTYNYNCIQTRQKIGGIFRTHSFFNMKGQIANLDTKLKDHLDDSIKLKVYFHDVVYGTDRLKPQIREKKFESFLRINGKQIICLPSQSFHDHVDTLIHYHKKNIWDIKGGATIAFSLESIGDSTMPIDSIDMIEMGGGLAVVLETQDPETDGYFSPEIDSVSLEIGTEISIVFEKNSHLPVEYLQAPNLEPYRCNGNVSVAHSNGECAITIPDHIESMVLIPSTSGATQWRNFCTWRMEKENGKWDTLGEWRLKGKDISVLKNPDSLINAENHYGTITTDRSGKTKFKFSFTHAPDNDSTSRKPDSLKVITTYVTEKVTYITILAEDDGGYNFLDFVLTLMLTNS